jgi:hypothetical protein
MNKDTLLNDQHYKAYMKKVHSMISRLPKHDQADIQREISSHIYESLNNYPDTTVEQALENLGEPQTYLSEWVVTKKLERATSTFNPFRIIWGLITGIVKHSAYAFKYTVFGLLYLFTLAFGFLCIAKVVAPSRTGLFIYPQGFTFGFNSNISNEHEVLGWKFIPICLFITILLYMIITVLLKMSLSKVKEQRF